MSNHRDNCAFACLIVLSFLYSFADLVPGRFVVTDEVFYKAAGRNWAMTGRFAAPEIVGRLAEGPPLTEVYFAQPPLYTFLFGVYTKLVGFGPRRCILYDVLIHLLLVWSSVIAARTVFRLPWSLAVLCGAISIPLGTVGRSDELGIVFLLWAAVTFSGRILRRSDALLGGGLIGLCGVTSLSALVFLGPLIVWELLRRKEGMSGRVWNFSLAVAAGFISAAVCVAPILFNHPTAYKQIIEHAGGQSGVLSSFVNGAAWKPADGLFHVWAEALWYGPEYGILVVGLLAFAALCRWIDKSCTEFEYSRILLAALLVICLVVLLPGKYLYLWFLGCWLLISCVALAAALYPLIAQSRRRLVLTFGACIWLAASIPYIHRKAILWMLPADQSLTANMERVRNRIPPDVRVMSSEYWWALADRDRVYDTLFSNPNIDQVDYIIVSGNGSGKPATPQVIRDKYKTADFKPVYNHLNSVPESFLGLRLSRSSYGFGAYILEKNADRHASSENQSHIPSP
jgi:hypothetical protein